MIDTELPDDLRLLDEQLKQAMRSFSPPADLDAKIASHVSRRSRLSLVPAALVPTSRVAKGAAAVLAASLLAGVGYVADRQMNGGTSSLFRDLERLVAVADHEGKPSEYALRMPVAIDGDYSATEPESKLSKGREDDNRRAQEFFARNEVQRDRRLDGVILGESVEEKGLEGQGDGDFAGGFSQSQGQQAGRQFRGELSDGSILANTTPYGGVETAQNAGLVGNIVIDEQNFDVLRFAPGNALGDKSESFKPKPTVTLLDGRPNVGGSHMAMSSKGKEGESRHSSFDESKRLASQATPGNGRGPAEGEPQPEPPTPQAVAVRQKVIRSGTVEFEVDSFDTALLTTTKLVMENGGFVASTDSAKLPNGKTRGAVTLRVPPERLDTLVLMLRGIGDLKSQKIAAQDVSKQYTDIESQLRAARAMEERLLDMIKKGSGAIKDLLAAEKELGVWREKIEKLEGEIRYYDNLIGLSTLTVVMEERDIKASAASIETETVSAGVETDDVEKARNEIIQAIDEAKGRVITSELKKLDAGQFAATIVAEVAPDRSGPVVDRLKQLGKVARLDIDRKQTTVDGTAPPVPGARVEQRPTRLTISLYNLANVAARLTTSATVASGDVESGYKQIMALVEKSGGRVVTSQLQRPQPDQIVATLQIEVPSAEAAATQAAIAALGEVMNLQLSENPDTANVTTAKQGFSVRIISTAGVVARETITIQLASPDVVKAHQTLAELAAKLQARVVQSNVNDGNGDNVNAILQIDLPRPTLAEWDETRLEAGDVLSRSVVRSTDLQNTLDSKLRINLTFLPADRLPPRQVTSAVVRVRSSESQQQAFLAQAKQLGGRLIDQTMNLDAVGRSTARVVFDVPRDKAATIFDALRAAGEIASMNTGTNPQAPEGPLSRTRFDLQFAEGDSLVGAEDGLWSSLKAGLATSLKGLGYSLRLLVVALCLVAPWVLVLWGGWKLLRRKVTPPTP
jgi:glycine cleavage system regulatory protein